MPGINLTNGPIYDECNEKPEKDCGEKHKFRVGNATLELTVDVNTDFNCDTD